MGDILLDTSVYIAALRQGNAAVLSLRRAAVRLAPSDFDFPCFRRSGEYRERRRHREATIKAIEVARAFGEFVVFRE